MPNESFFFPSFSHRVTPYLQWAKLSRVLTVRFEDLADSKKRKKECGRIFHYLSQYPNFSSQLSSQTKAQVIEKMLLSIDPFKSHTFSGLDSNRWRNLLTEGQTAKLENETREINEILGYI